VTPFIAKHPGGVAILRNAGKDSTAGFEKIGAHKKKQNDDDELSMARNWMASFLIGTVKPTEGDAKTEVDPEDILAQCLAEAEEKVKVETASTQPTRVVEPSVVKPVVQPTTSIPTTQPKPAVTTPTVQPQQPKAQSTTTTTSQQQQPKATVATKKNQPAQPSSETSYTTWILVAGGVAVAAVGAYAYFSNKQKI
jgi:outer membrane biosynthesis protein TonB